MAGTAFAGTGTQARRQHFLTMQLVGELPACKPCVIAQFCIAASLEQQLHTICVATSARDVKWRVPALIATIQEGCHFIGVDQQLLQLRSVAQRGCEVQL